MSTYALNYSVWTGVVGVVIEYMKRNGHVKWQTLAVKGFAEKGLVNLISIYLQSLNLPVISNGLDANYIFNGVIGAVASMYMKERSLQGAEEQILAALIGHRLASNFGTAFDSVTGYFGSVNNFFAGSSGYQGANVPNQGTPIPSQASGNNSGNASMY